ncbi:MAG: hypothetical protein ACREEM_23815 [Blastocatellia bacterium]
MIAPLVTPVIAAKSLQVIACARMIYGFYKFLNITRSALFYRMQKFGLAQAEPAEKLEKV